MDVTAMVRDINAEIQRLTSARVALEELSNGSTNEKPTPSNARSEAQRKRWAEAKRQQRATKRTK